MSETSPSFDAAVCIGRFPAAAPAPPRWSRRRWPARRGARFGLSGTHAEDRSPGQSAEMIAPRCPTPSRRGCCSCRCAMSMTNPAGRRSVRDGVAAVLAAQASMRRQLALVGHFKDPTSEYLNAFPQWRLQRSPLASTHRRHGGARRTVRCAAGGDVAAALAPLAEALPTAPAPSCGTGRCARSSRRWRWSGACCK